MEYIGNDVHKRESQVCLCRLGYRGQLEQWDFAIYKYSTQRHGELELAR